MKATEILRAFLDILDQAEPEVKVVTVTSEPQGSEEARRMNQVKDLLTDPFDTPRVSNAPQERYADLDSVTTDAGGGMHEPKEPEDIRGEHGSMFRDYLARVQRGE